MNLTNTVSTLQRVLGSDYDVNEEQNTIVFNMEGTDWTVFNVMTFDGTGVIHKDTEGYYTTSEVSNLPEGDVYEDDILVDYNEDFEWEDNYKSVPENNIVLVHEVHTGSLEYDWQSGTVSSYENSRYCSPECYVMKNGNLEPLRCDS